MSSQAASAESRQAPSGSAVQAGSTGQLMSRVNVNDSNPIGTGNGDTTTSQSGAEQPVCRICLEGEGQLIAPCRCRGSQKCVHRECLDRWRSTKEGSAFSRCTICQWRYRMKFAPSSSPEDRRTRRLRLRFLRHGEVFLLVLSLYLLLLVTGWGELAMSSSLQATNMCTGEKVSLSEQHLCGLLVFSVAFAVLLFLSNIMRIGDQRPGVESAMMMLVAITVLLMHSSNTIGVFYAVATALLPAHRILERHHQISKRGALAQEYVVQDLDGSGASEPALSTNHERVLRELGLW